MKRLKRVFFIAIVLVICINNNSFSQNFYAGYKNHLIKVWGKRITADGKKSIEESIYLLREAIASNVKSNKKSFFTVDTLYLVNFKGLETGFVSAIIWNKLSSCYYKYSYGSALNRKDMEGKTSIVSDASDILKSFNRDFKKAIETGNNKAYYNYTIKHEIFDGEWVSPIMCVRKKGHWQFIPFKGTGRAINYNFELPVKR